MMIKKKMWRRGARCVEDRRRWSSETPGTDKILVPGRPFSQNWNSLIYLMKACRLMNSSREQVSHPTQSAESRAGHSDPSAALETELPQGIRNGNTFPSHPEQVKQVGSFQ